VSLADDIRARLQATVDVPAVSTGMPPAVALTPAAVLVAITDRPAPGLLLTKRNEALRKHPGQVAFAGGRADPDDLGPEDTALREAWEEIALPRDRVEIVGRDATFYSPTGFAIVPVIGIVPPDLPLTPREYEVEAIFEVPLAHVLDGANHVRKAAEFNGVQREYVEIPWSGEHRIWGVTAAMIVNLARRLAA
jgi:8-oxo-dGTP pyrophosphatase MutT (NUDIX family)